MNQEVNDKTEKCLNRFMDKTKIYPIYFMYTILIKRYFWLIEIT